MTNSPPLPTTDLTTARPQRMRDLRAGGLTLAPVGEPSPVVTSGRAPTEHGFLMSLGRAIAAAADVGGRVLVFQARATPVRLHKWSEPLGLAASDLDRAVEEQLLAVDDSLVVRRLGGDVVGFASRPCQGPDAELLGGALAAGLRVVQGGAGPLVGLSPRLGVAVVEGSPFGATRLAVAVADAIEAVERTIAQTTNDTPYLVHNDYIRSRGTNQADIAEALVQALAERQVTLEFQPRVGITGLVPVGLEVFPRWHHHELGPVPTIEFLRVAERDGLLGPLGRQVRAGALAMARRWAGEGTLGQRRLWFDLAPIELVDEHFLAEVEELTSDADVTVGFELSDCPLLEEPIFAPVFDAIEGLGAQLALDNVRPLSLSLGRMQRLPINVVNLDRELVRSIVDDSGQRDLVRLICGFANDRGISVTACQVETAEELALLGELGVDQVQGYAVSEPLAEADLWPELDRPADRSVI